LILERILTKLYHIDLGIDDNTQIIVKKSKELKGSTEEQKAHDEKVEAVRSHQARARTAIMLKEKGINKAEKSLEARVKLNCHLQTSVD